jgi:hypothetical protein
LGTGTDKDWALEMMNNKNYVEDKMGSMIDEASEEMLAVARVFTYHWYGLDFDDVAVAVEKSDTDNRSNYVRGLLKDDIFIYGKCHIPYIRASHPKFRMSDPIRSDPQIRTGSVAISFFIHILFIKC